MGYRKVVLGGVEYKLTPKWYKEFQECIKNMEAVKKTDWDKVDKSELIDLRDVKIDRKLPEFQRIISYVNQVKNPYCFKVGNVRVRISYSEERNETLTEAFSAMLAML